MPETSAPKKEIHIQEKFITTYYLPEKDIIVEEWDGFAPSAGFREVSDGLIEIIKKRECGKVINNFKKGKVITQEDQNWINEDWFPRAVKAGLTKFAFLLADDVFNKMSVERIMEKTNFPTLQFRYFGSYDEAEKWLMHS